MKARLAKEKQDKERKYKEINLKTDQDKQQEKNKQLKKQLAKEKFYNEIARNYNERVGEQMARMKEQSQKKASEEAIAQQKRDFDKK